jgi:leader peptidase (prepilin peptidase) / N-methyltransferase
VQTGWVVVLSSVLTAALAVGGVEVVRRLPEPLLESDSADKPLYADIAARPGLRPVLGVVGAVVGATVGWRVGWEPILVCWIYLGAVGTVLAYVDALTRLLPTRLIAPSYGIVLGLVCLAALLAQTGHRLVGAGLGWLVMGGFYFLLWFVYPRGLGYGDVRLAGLLGLPLGYVGWGAVVTSMYAGFVLGAAGGLLLSVVRVVDRRRFAFGPFMLLGSLVGLGWGEALADWYTSR